MNLGMFALIVFLTMFALALGAIALPYFVVCKYSVRYIGDMGVTRLTYWLNFWLFILACFMMLPAIMLARFAYAWFVPAIAVLLAWAGNTFWFMYRGVRKATQGKATGWAVIYWASALLILEFIVYLGCHIGQR